VSGSLGRIVRRIPWLRLCLVLAALDLAVLAYELREHRRAQELHRLAEQGTLESLTEAVRSGGELRDRLLVNLGNYHLEQGLRIRSVAQIRSAVAYYREALRLDPELLAAKHNLELALHVLASAIPPREPREPLPPDMIRPSEMPLKPTDI
jgi:hypothetical protein